MLKTHARIGYSEPGLFAVDCVCIGETRFYRNWFLKRIKEVIDTGESGKVGHSLSCSQFQCLLVFHTCFKSNGPEIGYSLKSD